MPIIRIPDGLRRFTGGAGSFSVEGSTVAAALEAAFRLHPDLRIRLVDETGQVHPYLAAFRNQGELARTGLVEAALSPGDTLSFIEAIGGGAAAGAQR